MYWKQKRQLGEGVELKILFYLRSKIATHIPRHKLRPETGYALLITDVEAARKFYETTTFEEMKKKYQDIRDGITGQSFEYEVKEAIKGVIGTTNGIAFFETYDTDKLKFRKIYGQD